MKTLHIIILITFYQFILAQCETGFTEINNECYYQSDLEVLQTFIDSSTTINMDMDANDNGIIEPLELGLQEWESGRLTELNSVIDNLSGPIPENIGNLTNLTYLDLSYNNLSGPIPENIGNLTNLTYLDLSYNNLSGTIPDGFENLFNLTTLKLRYNNLTGTLLNYIHNFPNLSYIDIGYNSFTGILSNEIGNLIDLSHIDFSENVLSGTIPVNIGNLSSLNFLGLSGNNFSGIIPYSIGNLIELEELRLERNQLTGIIPESIGNLTNLNLLFLRDNNLSGPIPINIGNLISLNNLDFSNNNLSGAIPESIGELISINNLGLAGNLLNGVISDSICNLNNFENISLSNNQLCGPFPDCLDYIGFQDCNFYPECLDNFVGINDYCYSQSDLNVLQEFIVNSSTIDMDLDINSNGSIEPLELGTQYWENGRLKILYCGFEGGGNAPNCELSGIIPESIGDLSQLEYLYLTQNNLTGSIPESIGDLNNLTRLHLGSNQLSGLIPESIGNMANLEHLKIDYNNLSGNIPNNLGNLTNLTHIYLKYNNLNGQIPESIGNLNSLTHLYLNSNYLSGSIPSTICDLTNLRYLDLSFNELSGEIPGNVENMNLNWFSLTYNRLQGDIPEGICGIANSNSILLQYNQFCLPYPSCSSPINYGFQDCNYYPNCLENFIGIDDYCYNQNDLFVLQEYIDYSIVIDNELDINNNDIIEPLELGNQDWRHGRLINLSTDQMVYGGELPSSFGELDKLEILNLNANYLNGIIPESIGDLTNLKMLYLGHNNFVDGIPESLGNLSELSHLSLLRNYDLGGTIPESFTNLESLHYLSLSEINLTGNFPESICGFSGNLNLASNNLSGPLPDCFIELAENAVINLHGNNLIGVIPEDICGIDYLYNYDFTFNNFCPPYPDCLDNSNLNGQNCILGCMDSDASNYYENANNDNGSCIFYHTSTFNTGNNLISFIGVPSPSTVAEFLGDYPVNFILGQGQGLFRIDGEWSGNLTYFDGYSGYWVNASEPFELQYNLSNTFDTCEDYPLSIGNNLVSYIGTNNQNTLTGLSGDDNYTDHINFIISQGQGLFNSNGEWSGNLTNLNKNNGYWLNLKSSWPFENDNGNKIFRWGIGEDCTEPDVSSNLIKELSNIPAEFQFVQSTEQAFYLIKDIEDIEDIENGDIITAYCGEQLVGSVIWDGDYTAIPVMGRDVSEQTVGFCEPGEKPQFFWTTDQGEGRTELGLALSPSKGNIPGFANLGVYTFDKLKSVENEILPTEWSLAPAYPNPFNPITTIEIGVPEMVETQHAGSVQIYDINGRLINTLIDGQFEPGFHTIEWDATGFPSGVYFVKMVAGDPSKNSGQGFTKSQKLILMK